MKQDAESQRGSASGISASAKVFSENGPYLPLAFLMVADRRDLVRAAALA